MVYEDITLRKFLERIENLSVRQALLGENLECSLFFLSSGLRNFIESEKLSRPISISLCRRTEKRVVYSVSSEKNRRVLASNGVDWYLAGGEISPDNVRGSYYLKLPLSNFVTDSEARIYFASNDSFFSLYRPKPIRKPLNRPVLS